MKKFKALIILVFILSVATSFQLVSAQAKTKAEQEKELNLQQAIEAQKKALTDQKADQKAAQDEAEMKMKDQEAQLKDLMKDIRVNGETNGRPDQGATFYNSRGNRAYSFGQPFVNGAPGSVAFFDGTYGSDAERTTWDFTKSVKESTFSRDYSFDVEKTVKTVILSVSGDCKEGEIHIKIIMPDGKDYSDVVIDQYGNLNWRKSFSISDTENQDKTGEWKFQINSSKATGYFKISLQTF